MKSVLYLKIEQCIQVTEVQVRIGDIAKMECINQKIVDRIKTEPLLQISADKNQKTVISVLAVIRKIHEIYPELEVQNIGECDFIVSLKPKKSSKGVDALKVFGVCLISFFGSVFAMMTFNEDVSALDSFRKVYTWVIGSAPTGSTILELSYSLGLGIGIIGFFNHIGKKKLTQEPSPVEVEMSGYDKQVYTTLIQYEGRKGLEKDVD